MITSATLSLVLPTFSIGRPGPEFTPAQLAFAAIVSLVLYAVFVVAQTVRHRDFFLPLTSAGEVVEQEEHAEPPSNRAALASLGLLLIALVAVVGLAKLSKVRIGRKFDTGCLFGHKNSGLVGNLTTVET